jgi:hypothetical protein
LPARRASPLRTWEENGDQAEHPACYGGLTDYEYT